MELERKFVNDDFCKNCRVCLEPHEILTIMTTEFRKIYKEITTIEVFFCIAFRISYLKMNFRSTKMMIFLRKFVLDV